MAPTGSAAAGDPAERDDWLSLREALHEERRALRGGAHPAPASLAAELAARQTAGLSALCLSGGGVRSAVFSLGFLQGIAARAALSRFDYLSTVSGGGYSGAAVLAYARHLRAEAELDEAPKAPTAPTAGGRASTAPAVPAVPAAPGPTARAEQRIASRPGGSDAFIEHLREYGSYLVPRLGPTSPDAWTLGAIALRNLAILWAALLPILLLAVLLPQWYAVSLISWTTRYAGLGPGTTAAVLACLGFAWCFVYPELASGDAASGPQRPGWRARFVEWLRRTPGFFALFLAPLLASAMLLQLGALSFAGAGPGAGDGPGPAVAALRGYARTWLPGLVVLLVVLRLWVRIKRRGWPGLAGAALQAAGLGLGALLFVAFALAWFVSVELALATLEPSAAQRVAMAAAGTRLAGNELEPLRAVYVRATMYTVPLVLGLWYAFDIVYLWVASTFGRDTDREYLARLENFLLGSASIWLGACALSFREPAWLFALVADHVPAGWGLPALAVVLAACVALLARVGTQWLSAPTHEVDPTTADGRRLRRQARVAATAAVVLLAALAVFLSNAGPRLADPRSGLIAQGTACWALVGEHLSGRDVVGAAADANCALLRPARAARGAAPGQAPSDIAAPGADPCASRSGGWGCRFATAAIDAGAWPRWTLLMVAIGLFALAASLALRINRFSLHELYRSRLVRTFLGAARVEPASRAASRQPHPFTGFDAKDNLRMHELQGLKPLLVINAALNLSGSSKLWWQERKAAPFSLTPYHCGSMLPQVGYRRSCWYGSRRTIAGDEAGLSLGSAIAVSGAATSPNQGYNTSPLVAVMLTLFNLRLGLWLGNPMSGRARGLLAARARRRRADQAVPADGDTGPARAFASRPCAADAAEALDEVDRARRVDAALDAALSLRTYKAHQRGNPTLAAWPLIRELVGFSNERGTWINLSDGGHFDNLGVYEMVLRRCRLVVCVDATCDPESDSHHLARVIRMLSVDLGVEVTALAWDPPSEAAAAAWNAPAEKDPCFAFYRIDYPPLEGSPTDSPETLAARPVGPADGLLLVVKAAMLPDAPPDVASYARAHPEFPNESTQDQFFGESQFESYRRLGLHVARRLLRLADDGALLDTPDRLLATLLESRPPAAGRGATGATPVRPATAPEPADVD